MLRSFTEDRRRVHRFPKGNYRISASVCYSEAFGLGFNVSDSSLIVCWNPPAEDVWGDGRETQGLQDSSIRCPLSQHQPDPQLFPELPGWTCLAPSYCCLCLASPTFWGFHLTLSLHYLQISIDVPKLCQPKTRTRPPAPGTRESTRASVPSAGWVSPNRPGMLLLVFTLRFELLGCFSLTSPTGSEVGRPARGRNFPRQNLNNVPLHLSSSI